MSFEWNDHKNILNIEKHGLDFADAYMVFDNPILTKVDNRRNYGEVRWIALGQLDGACVVIVYTMRHKNIRIVSLRRANRYERKIYKTYLQK